MGRISMRGGLMIQAGTYRVPTQGRREEAMWDGAVREIEAGGLLESKGPKKEIYYVTREGFQIANALKLKYQR